MIDSNHSCQINPKKYLRLAIRGAPFPIRYRDVSIEELLRTNVRVWELESLYLEPVEKYRPEDRIIGVQYYLKSNTEHYLALMWLSNEVYPPLRDDPDE